MRKITFTVLCLIVLSLGWSLDTFATNNPHQGETRCGVIKGNTFYYASGGGSWWDLNTDDTPRANYNGTCSWAQQGGSVCGIAEIKGKTELLYTHKWTCPPINVPLDTNIIFLVIATTALGCFFIHKKLVYT